MKWSLGLGRYSGIKVQVHWTFLFLIGWIVFLELRKGSDTNTILLTIGFVLSVFLCVVLHEFGHALTAQRFNIKTRSITLLPIGGLARLEKMPEDPKQELLIAVAGPMVNVAIALLLYIALPIESFVTDPEQLKSITPSNFLFYLLSVNVFLVLFNAIPAFPMDGGRVLRALLALKMDRAKATQIASNLGQLIALIFVIFGFFVNPFLIFIGIFVFFGAYAENAMVQQMEFMKDHTVKESMMTHFTTLAPIETINDAADKLLAGSDHDFLVVENETVLGLITRNHIINGLRNHMGEVAVQELMDKEFLAFESTEKLGKAFVELQKKPNSYYPVLENGKLVGVFNLENLNEFIMVQSALHQ